jgi:exonuclease SbcC
MMKKTNPLRWRIESITVANFRGIAKKRTFSFACEPGLIHGGTGVGKSTLAQAIQWTLYGEFPKNVLQKAAKDRFLSPVGGVSKSWFGEVAFGRGKERLVIQRDHAKKSFVVITDGERFEDDEAEWVRDETLGLDQATFERAILLQQGRIRGLLMDTPADRNMALDRLLGMDVVDDLCAAIKPKNFAKAADEWREKIKSEREYYKTRSELVAEQRSKAQKSARKLGYLNKDFNLVGLKKAYVEVGKMLDGLGRKYKVALKELPSCKTLSQAESVSKSIKGAIKQIRIKSELRKRLRPLERKLTKLAKLYEDWEDVLDYRNKASQALRRLIAKHGERGTVEKKRRSLQAKLNNNKEDLKSLGALRQLLVDARDYLAKEPSDACPVCEQSLPKGARLSTKLKKRINALATKSIAQKEKAISSLEKELLALAEVVEKLETSEKVLAKNQKDVDGKRKEIIEALGRKGIVESKIEKSLSAEITKLEVRSKDLKKGLEAMEKDLDQVELRERNIHDGLLPVLKKRKELEELENDWEKKKKAHRSDELRAKKMENTGLQLQRILDALLEAKDAVATDRLEEAKPRAQELYDTLTDHPRFDTREIRTTQRARKVDYDFEVSMSDKVGSAREARLVLSDGQLTATALGLFFALAESAAHGLDLLYVDDPTQNLDLPHKESMAEVIADLATRKQVIVSTHDEDFVANLEAEDFHDEAIVHHIKKWDGNPTVKTSIP